MSDQQLSNDSKLMAALSYLWLISVVMLVLKKEDAFVQFHAKQGTVIFLGSLILWFIPILGWFLNIFALIAMIVGFLKAYAGEKYKMPVVGDLAEKIRL